jgi:Peptidase family M28
MAYGNGILMKVAGASAVSLFCGVLLLWPGGSDAQEGGRGPRGKLSSPQAELLTWSMPPGVDKSYDAIDADKLHGYVREQAAISLRSRDAGNQYWGRIAGMPSGTETQNWIKEKFKAMGVPYETVTIPASADYPKSWGIDVSSNGKSLHLKSAFPLIDFPETAGSLKGDHELDTVWVSLGQESDFLGKDVRGKAVFIYSIPTPSVLIQSSMWMESVGRAQKAGAAAIIVDVAIPGNMQYVSHLNGGRARDIKVPVFTLGDEDGRAVEQMNAAAKGVGLKTHVRWEVGEYRDLKQDIVIGKLPGMTDENIVMLSHTDGFFEGAADNAAGTAAMLGTAEYFAKMPKEKRRRTLYFVALLDHHSGDRGSKWLHDNFQSVFAKTAMIVNSEHVAVLHSVLDRRWGSNDRPSLVATNAYEPSWWGVYGSERLARTIARGLATFGVPTQLAQGGSAGEAANVQFDAPSFYLDNKGTFYHTDADTPATIPASGLKNVVQAFAKIYDDVNTLELKDLQAPPSDRPGAASSSSSR